MNKTKYLPTFACLVVEMGISGYFTPVDGFWISTRLGLLVVFCFAVIAENVKLIQWLPLVLIALSLMSIRHQWQDIEQAKLKSLKSDYVTHIKEPVKPRLEDCDKLNKSWAIDNCQKRNYDLSAKYDLAVAQYNNRIIKSETKIETAKVELTWYDQQPVWIYVILVCVMSWLTLVSTPEESKVAEIKNSITEKDIRAMIITRLEAGRSNLSIAEELKIDRRNIAQVRKEIGLHRTMNVQQMSNVVKFEGKKRA